MARGHQEFLPWKGHNISHYRSTSGAKQKQWSLLWSHLREIPRDNGCRSENEGGLEPIEGDDPKKQEDEGDLKPTEGDDPKKYLFITSVSLLWKLCRKLLLVNLVIGSLQVVSRNCYRLVPSQTTWIYWPNVGFPLAILALAFSCQATLAQYWVSIGNIGIGNILSRDIRPILACHLHLWHWLHIATQ